MEISPRWRALNWFKYKAKKRTTLLVSAIWFYIGEQILASYTLFVHKSLAIGGWGNGLKEPLNFWYHHMNFQMNIHVCCGIHSNILRFILQMGSQAKAKLFQQHWCGISSNFHIADMFDRSPSNSDSCNKNHVLSRVNTLICNLDSQCNIQCPSSSAGISTSNTAAYRSILKPLYNLISCEIRLYTDVNL